PLPTCEVGEVPRQIVTGDETVRGSWGFSGRRYVQLLLRVLPQDSGVQGDQLDPGVHTELFGKTCPKLLVDGKCSGAFVVSPQCGDEEVVQTLPERVLPDQRGEACDDVPVALQIQGIARPVGDGGRALLQQGGDHRIGQMLRSDPGEGDTAPTGQGSVQHVHGCYRGGACGLTP